jgi:hypothetical protein
MKTMLKLAGMLLLIVVMGLQSNVANAKVATPETSELDGCYLSAGEVTAIQTALANYVAGWTLSFVVSNMSAITADVCDGDVPMGGTITVIVDYEPVTYNWERQGGSNVIVVWPV